MKVSFVVEGKVQGVMFRKSFCVAAKHRAILAGATNLEDRNRVLCSLEGSKEDIDKFIEEIKNANELNSWGANVESVNMLEEFRDFDQHDYDNRELKETLNLHGVKLNI